MTDISSFEDFCPPLAEMLKSTGKFPALSTENNLCVIRALMSEIRPVNTLEIGLSYGGSALAFCASHRAYSHGTHTAIDPHQKTIWENTGLAAINRAGLTSYLDFREGYSAIELPKILEEGTRFGLIYIDGSHLFEDVFVDAYFAIRLLADEGIVLFDDSTDPHVAKVIRFLARNGNGLTRFDLSVYRQNGLLHNIASHLGKAQLTGFQRTGETIRKWDAKFVRF